MSQANSSLAEPYRFQLESTYAYFIQSNFGTESNANLAISIGIFIGLHWIVGALYSIDDIRAQSKRILFRFKIQPESSQVCAESIQRLVPQVMFNQALSVLISCGVFWVKEHYRPAAGTLPGVGQLVAEILVFMALGEILFYYTHRILHHPVLYRAIHKQHHQWKTPIALSAFYCHPLEHCASNLSPVFVGPLLMRSHHLVQYVWMALVTLVSLTNHSGYKFPYLPIPSKFHDDHHLRFTGNFGAYGVLDWLHGTTLLPDSELKKK